MFQFSVQRYWLCLYAWTLKLNSGSRTSCKGIFRPYIYIECAEWEEYHLVLSWWNRFCWVQIEVSYTLLNLLSSTDCSEIVGLFCGLSTSNQWVLFVEISAQQPQFSQSYFIGCCNHCCRNCCCPNCCRHHCCRSIKYQELTIVFYQIFVNWNEPPTFLVLQTGWSGWNQIRDRNQIRDSCGIGFGFFV